MTDNDAHMQFFHAAADAWFNYATAGLAALGAWQNHISNQLDGSAQRAAAISSPYEQGLEWWTSLFFPSLKAKPAAPADFGAAFFQFAPMRTLHNGFDPLGMFNPLNAFGAAPPAITQGWTAVWFDVMSAYSRAMPQFSWTMMQGPMTAWLMSAGLPYAVAAPTARGNTASLQAAAAARKGLDSTYANYATLQQAGADVLGPMLECFAAYLPEPKPAAPAEVKGDAAAAPGVASPERRAVGGVLH